MGNNIITSNYASITPTINGLTLNSAELVKEDFEDDVRPANKKVNIDVYEVTDPNEFLEVLKETWNQLSPKDRWKVDSPQTKEGFEEWIKDHPNAKMYVTPNGTTVALNGEDIIAVASPPHVGEGLTAVQWAITQGGRKLDSYESNYGLYRKLGFKTNNYTPFKEGVNEHWVNGRDHREDIIFMTYEGKSARGDYNMSRKEYDTILQKDVKPKIRKYEDTPGSDEWEDSGYYKAQNDRDNYIEEHREELMRKWAE